METRRFKKGDERDICEVIKRDILAENIYDYSKSSIKHLIEQQNEELILKRSKSFHVYTFLDNDKIIGVGMIGPYWGSMSESSFFTIFRDPDYKAKGLGRFIIETLQKDEYYLRADRVEIPASITAVEFYKHFGWKFKKLGNIVDKEGIYRMEKFPRVNTIDNNLQYNMRPYIDNEHYNYKEFVYNVKKVAYKKYVEENWGQWNDEEQRKLFEIFINNVQNDCWIIQLNGKGIGFYNGETLEDGSYEIGNICIIPEYQGKGIGTNVLNDIIELHKDHDIHIQYFKQNPVGNLYKKLGFIEGVEKPFHYTMVKYCKKDKINKSL